MKRISPLLTVFLIGIIIIGLFSCSDDGDPRKKAKQSLGEPADIQYEEFAGYEIERWIFPRTDWNMVYEFRKSSANCGGTTEWYIYRVYYASGWGYELYDPQPVIEHDPIVAAPFQKQIPVQVTVTLNPKAIQDTQILETRLFYRTVGDSLFNSMIMAPSDSIYSGDIPANYVTEKGLEYYIAATSDISTWEMWSYMPEKQGDVFLIEVPGASTGEVITQGKPVKTVPKIAVPPSFETDTLLERSSPVGP